MGSGLGADEYIRAIDLLEKNGVGIMAPKADMVAPARQKAMRDEFMGLIVAGARARTLGRESGRMFDIRICASSGDEFELGKLRLLVDGVRLVADGILDEGDADKASYLAVAEIALGTQLSACSDPAARICGVACKVAGLEILGACATRANDEKLAADVRRMRQLCEAEFGRVREAEPPLPSLVETLIECVRSK
jgi:hypothetical protein